MMLRFVINCLIHSSEIWFICGGFLECLVEGTFWHETLTGALASRWRKSFIGTRNLLLQKKMLLDTWVVLMLQWSRLSKMRTFRYKHQTPALDSVSVKYFAFSKEKKSQREISTRRLKFQMILIGRGRRAKRAKRFWTGFFTLKNSRFLTLFDYLLIAL